MTIHQAYAFPSPSNPTSLSPAQPDEDEDNGDDEGEDEDDDSLEAAARYLDKLMMAESGGRANAKNPLSTALGPFQFINSTFMAVVNRHFADEVEGLSRSQILSLRTDMNFSRRAAIAFNNDNAAFLAARGLEPTFAHLRLSHLLGPQGAAQLLSAEAGTKLTKVFPSSVIRANPFMKRLTVAGLVNRAERESGVGVWKVRQIDAFRDAEGPSAPLKVSERKAEELPAKTSPSERKSATRAGGDPTLRVQNAKGGRFGTTVRQARSKSMSSKRVARSNSSRSAAATKSRRKEARNSAGRRL